MIGVEYIHRICVGNIDGCVKFEFNDKSLIYK